MSLETDLYALLSQDPTVLSILNGKDYVWLGAIPKGQPDSPAIVVQTVLTTHYYGADGVNALMLKRVQIDSYAARYTDAVTISATVRSLLKNFTGLLPTTSVQGALVGNEMDLPEEPGDAGNVFRRVLQVDFWHTETA